MATAQISGEDHADGNDAGQQHALILLRHIAASDHHAPEDEDEEQRLQECLQEELNSVPAGDVRVTCQHGAKCFPVQSRKLLPV
jgi:hypothetical protein